ncbi:hypothetical protein [Leucobacter sp. M11]|uniref:hypothetical protein n=1 Tax=Leucobacter sp. M11 TaxID=2993565 RepID=UPI002D7E4828|nr:hypothetical protein [Leucobacter sp. M11]MEB4614124.1 hypothetical protein [Leucobacter sp. M11]
MAENPGTELASLEARRTKATTTKKNVRSIVGATLAVGFIGTLALPAYAAPSSDDLSEQVFAKVQQLTAEEVEKQMELTRFDAQTQDDLDAVALKQAEQEAAEKKAATDKLAAEMLKIETEQEEQASAAALAVSNKPATTSPAAAPAAKAGGAPASASAGALLASARSQIGSIQDCTVLIERALRDLGYNVGDLGVWGALGYGTPISASEVRAGDIMMRGADNGGHVAMYSGDGVNHQAIHSGWNGGNTVETHYDADPAGYSGFVRIG